MNQKVVLFIIVAAAIVAIGGFLLVSFLVPGTSEPPIPEPPPDVNGDNLTAEKTVIVGNDTILVPYDPNKVVVIVPATPELPPTESPPTETPSPTDTATPPDGGNGDGGVTLPVTTVTPRPPKVIFVPYTVRDGDTYYSISTYLTDNNNATSVVLIGRHVPASELVAGNVIQVPVGNPAFCPAPYRPYVVLEGENAFRIAQKVGTTPETLRQINGLDANYTVYLSDVICVP